jgi:CubicO group peptidase (beta-lactamase class C family)
MSWKSRSAHKRFACVTSLVGVAVIVFTMVGLASAQVTGTATISPNPQVDRIFATWDKSDSPGCALAVSREGQIIYKRGYGMADLDHQIGIDPATTVFHAASLAKQFTAMAIVLLVKQQKLSLDDEAKKYVPELANINPHPTIRHLLNHTSGIRDQWLLATLAGWRMSDDTITLKSVLDFVGRMKSLNFTPGRKFSYSNTNYTLAGKIVKEASGQSLAEFVREQIFLPLNMQNSIITESHGQIVKNRAYGYRGEYPNFEMRMPNYDLTGPTNLLTTVEDLLRWAHNFDTKTVGREEAISAMLTPPAGLPLPEGFTTKFFYGLGIYVHEENGRQIVEHDGRDAGYRSHLILFPNDGKLSVALLCNVLLPNQSRTSKLVRDVAAVYLNEPFISSSSSPATCQRAPSPVDLTKYLGRYYNEEIDAIYEVGLSSDGKSLTITRNKYDAITLSGGSDDQFNMENFSGPLLPCSSVRFKKDPEGNVTEFRMEAKDTGLLNNFPFEKCEDNRCPPKRP